MAEKYQLIILDKRNHQDPQLWIGEKGTWEEVNGLLDEYQSVIDKMNATDEFEIHRCPVDAEISLADNLGELINGDLD